MIFFCNWVHVRTQINSNEAKCNSRCLDVNQQSIKNRLNVSFNYDMS